MLGPKLAVAVLVGLVCLLLACARSHSSTGAGNTGGGTTPLTSSGHGGTGTTGGTHDAGEKAASGGTRGGGGATSTAGTVASTGMGGAVSTGGIAATGGLSFTPATGGASSSGGTTATGPRSGTGGTTATGGASSSGGTTATGPRSSTGGTTATGGATATPLSGYARVQGPITLSGLDNTSGITWKPETDTFFVVCNVTHALHEYTADFKTRLRTIVLDNGGTDTEDVAYLDANRFAVVDETNEAWVVTIADGATSANLSATDAEHYVISARPTTANRGFEGIAFRPAAGSAGEFIVCQEGGVAGTPVRVLSFDRRASAGTSSYADGTLVVREPWNALGKLDSLATDLAAICYDAASGTLLVLSQEGSLLLRVAPATGEVLDRRTLSGSPQYEGVTLAGNGRLVLVSEPNFVEIYRAE